MICSKLTVIFCDGFCTGFGCFFDCVKKAEMFSFAVFIDPRMPFLICFVVANAGNTAGIIFFIDALY